MVLSEIFSVRETETDPRGLTWPPSLRLRGRRGRPGGGGELWSTWRSWRWRGSRTRRRSSSPSSTSQVGRETGGRGQLINMELFPNEAKPPFLSSRQSISGMEVEFLTFDSVMRLREPISLNFRLHKNRKESELRVDTFCSLKAVKEKANRNC